MSVTRSDNADFVLAVHGGAGVIERGRMTDDLERAFRAGLEDALAAGRTLLAANGSSLDAVVAAVSVLEDNILFNAGRGAAFTCDGTHELDAAVMNGTSLRAGAVTLVSIVKNPVKLARLVMEQTEHVMMASSGAEALARAHGLEIVEPSYFFSQRRWDSLQRLRGAEGARREPATEADKHGTVGAVALDRAGHLAAATSTGGRTNKLAGRVGDSPLIGAGTYANDAGAAVSCTGEGEYFIAAVAAHTISALIELNGWTVARAADCVIGERLKKLGGTGGLIALDRSGNIAMPFSTAAMYRGYVREDGTSEVNIFR